MPTAARLNMTERTLNTFFIRMLIYASCHSASHIKSCNQAYYNSEYTTDATAKFQILVVLPVPHCRPDGVDNEKQAGDNPTNVGKNTLLGYVCQNETKEKNSHRNLDLHMIGKFFHRGSSPFAEEHFITHPSSRRVYNRSNSNEK